MGFPGWRMDKEDAHGFAVAVRETEEEVGLSLSEGDRCIGRLSDLNARPHRGFLGMAVSPYVFHLEREVEFTPNYEVAEVVSVLQTPAFLCRQTGFIQRVAATGLPVNIKKGQFLAPWDMKHVVEKARATGNDNIMVCERGVSFGYNNLVSDMRSLAVIKSSFRMSVGTALFSTKPRTSRTQRRNSREPSGLYPPLSGWL